jgi:hypothetical protein
MGLYCVNPRRQGGFGNQLVNRCDTVETPVPTTAPVDRADAGSGMRGSR